MEPYLQRQHRLLSEKNTSAKASWQKLHAIASLPTSQSDQLASFKPKVVIDLAGHWYLVAKQQAFRKQPAFALSMQYPITLLIVALIVFGILNFKVMPNLITGLDLHSATLPKFSQFIYQYYLIICCVTVLFLGLFTAAVFLINRAVQDMQLIPTWLQKLQPLQNLVKNHNQYVTGHKLQAWNIAGIIINDADVDGFITKSEWQLAQQLNTQAMTLKAATPNFDSTWATDANQQLNTLSTAILGPVIGAFVIAIYLPIFQLGSTA